MVVDAAPNLYKIEGTVPKQKSVFSEPHLYLLLGSKQKKKHVLDYLQSFAPNSLYMQPKLQNYFFEISLTSFEKSIS